MVLLLGYNMGGLPAGLTTVSLPAGLTTVGLPAGLYPGLYSWVYILGYTPGFISWVYSRVDIPDLGFIPGLIFLILGFIPGFISWVISCLFPGLYPGFIPGLIFSCSWVYSRVDILLFLGLILGKIS